MILAPVAVIPAMTTTATTTARTKTRREHLRFLIANRQPIPIANPLAVDGSALLLTISPHATVLVAEMHEMRTRSLCRAPHLQAPHLFVAER